MRSLIYAFAVLLGCAAPVSATAEEPLNFILVLVDDLGWTDLGVQGSTYYETPHLDRLAAQGMRFTNAYAACAVCSPTRAAVQTGRYPARLYVTDWIRSRFQGGTIPEDKINPCLKPVSAWRGRKVLCPPNALWMESDEITIAEALQPAGYTSCYIGKWHLGTDPWYPTEQGYDLNFGGCDYGQPPNYFDPFHQPRGRHPMLRAGIPHLPGRQPGQYLTDRETDEAVAFLQEHGRQPFFLQLAHYAVHTPIQAKEDVTQRYAEKPKSEHHKNARYAAMVESVDDAMGRIMATLDELQIADRTVILFTSDNGGLAGPTSNAPLRSGKGYPYEGGIRVPLIARWPGVTAAGSVSDVPVISMDLFPTIVRAAGRPLPADRPIDGLDLRPVLAGGDALPRDALFWHFPHYRHQPGPYSIIRQGDWKYIHWYEGPVSLFNLRDDLGEQHDLAAEQPARVAALHQRLNEHLQQVNAKIPIPKPAP